MGRKAKYITPEEKRQAQNEYAQSYYDRNKEMIKEKARKKYELSKHIQSNNTESLQ
jgi:hypothetical protein